MALGHFALIPIPTAMPKLTARYYINLPVSIPLEVDQPRMAVLEMDDTCEVTMCDLGVIGDFAVSFGFEVTNAGSMIPNDPERRAIASARVMIISVQGTEVDSPPARPADRNVAIFAEYFQGKSGRYKSAAREAARRLIDYFRYEFQIAQLRSVDDLDAMSFENPHWLNEAGQDVPSGILVFQVGINRFEGARVLTTADCNSVADYVLAPPEIDLATQLLAEARDALAAGDLRRAVLDLAISVEVAVKHATFAPASLAGRVMERLESSGRMRAGVKDLIRAIGKSGEVEFHIAYPQSDQAIIALFASRNRVAHHGTAETIGDRGSLVPVTAGHLIRWIQAVEDLRNWLSTVTTAQPANG